MSLTDTTIKNRILSKESFSSADIETNYASVVKTIGGTYYVGGVATGPVNGSLDWRNFSSNAGITNQFKSNSNNITLFETTNLGVLNATLTKTIVIPVPSPTPAMVGSIFGYAFIAGFLTFTPGATLTSPTIDIYVGQNRIAFQSITTPLTVTVVGGSSYSWKTAIPGTVGNVPIPVMYGDAIYCTLREAAVGGFDPGMFSKIYVAIKVPHTR